MKKVVAGIIIMWLMVIGAIAFATVVPFAGNEYVADLESELTPTLGTERSRAYTRDTKKVFLKSGGTWTSLGGGSVSSSGVMSVLSGTNILVTGTSTTPIINTTPFPFSYITGSVGPNQLPDLSTRYSLTTHQHGALYINVRNETGSTIPALRAVTPTGGFNNYPLVQLASNTSITYHLPIGVTMSAISDQATGSIIQSGILSGVNTNAWAVGTKLYLSTGGVLTSNPEPQGQIIFMGQVMVQDNNGSILLYDDKGTDYVSTASGQDAEIRLGDNAGVNKLLIENYNDQTVASIDSLGNIVGTIPALNSHIANTSNPHQTSINNLGGVDTTGAITGETLVYDLLLNKWTPQQISIPVSAGAAVTYYLNDDDSDIFGYEVLHSQPTTSAEVQEFQVVSSGTGSLLIDPYATGSEGLGRNLIEGGLWQFDTYSSVSNILGQASIGINVYSRNTSSVETLLFSTSTGTIYDLDPALYSVDVVQPAFGVNYTDRIVVKYYAMTTGPTVTVSFYHGGIVHYSHLHTPMSTTHNQQPGLQGGISGTPGEYYHLSAAQYTAATTTATDGIAGLYAPSLVSTQISNSATANDWKTGSQVSALISGQLGTYSGTTNLVTAGSLSVTDIRSYSTGSFNKVTVNAIVSANAPTFNGGSLTSMTYSQLTGTPTWNQNTTGTSANVSGTPALPNGTTATTQASGDNSTKLATTLYVASQIGTQITSSATANDWKTGSQIASLISGQLGTYTGSTTIVTAGSLSVTDIRSYSTGSFNKVTANAIVSVASPTFSISGTAALANGLTATPTWNQNTTGTSAGLASSYAVVSASTDSFSPSTDFNVNLSSGTFRVMDNSSQKIVYNADTTTFSSALTVNSKQVDLQAGSAVARMANSKFNMTMGIAGNSTMNVSTPLSTSAICLESTSGAHGCQAKRDGVVLGVPSNFNPAESLSPLMAESSFETSSYAYIANGATSAGTLTTNNIVVTSTTSSLQGSYGTGDPISVLNYAYATPSPTNNVTISGSGITSNGTTSFATSQAGNFIATIAGYVSNATITNDQQGSIFQNATTRYISTSGSNTTYNSMLSNAKYQIGAGISHLGEINLFNAQAIRNNSAALDDSGSLQTMRAHKIAYGHKNLNASSSPTTTTFQGIYIKPFIQKGSIGNMYDIYLDTVGTGGTITGQHYPIYSATSDTSFFFGPVQASIYGSVTGTASNATRAWEADTLSVAGSPGDCLKSGGSGSVYAGSCSSISAYGTIQNAGSPLTQRTTLNFTGAGVSCSDVSSVSTCTIPGGGGTSYNDTIVTGGTTSLTQRPGFNLVWPLSAVDNSSTGRTDISYNYDYDDFRPDPNMLGNAALNNLVLTSNTTGTLLTHTTSTWGSGMLKLSSGVLGTAAPGTDYAPATSGSSILKGSGAGGFSNAVASDVNALYTASTFSANTLFTSSTVTNQGNLWMPGLNTAITMSAVSAEPTVITTNNAKIYSALFAGSVAELKTAMTSTYGHFMGHVRGLTKQATWSPTGNTATLPVVDAFTAPTATGSATSRAVATTNLFTRAKRLGYVSTANANNMAGYASAAIQWTVGDGQGAGGFTFIGRAGVSDASAVGTGTFFLGMSGATTVPVGTTTDPGTLTNVIGLCNGTGDSNLKICYGGSAAQTKIDLGANFPKNTASVDMYELTLFAPSTSNNTVYYHVKRLGTLFEAFGTLTGTAGTVLPASTTFIGPTAWRGNGSTATAVGIDIQSIFMETDF